MITSNRKKISYILKVIVIISAILGTIISASGEDHSFMGGSTTFMYFTIQSNIAMAIISAIGLGYFTRNREKSRTWYVIKFVGTVAITLTGVVFCFVLAPTLGPKAWNFHNVLTHVVVPVCSVIDFFVVIAGNRIPKKNVFFVIIPPLLYAIYAGIGYVQGWEFYPGYNYPYFFLNWGSPAGAFGFTDELPFMGTAWWILVLLLFLIVVGYGYLLIADLIDKRKN